MASLRNLTYDDTAEFPRPGERIPTSIRFSKDGKTVYYLYPEHGTELSLWAYDVASKERRLIAEAPSKEVQDTFEEEMRRQRARLSWHGITQYQWGGDVLMIPHHGTLYLSRSGSPLTALPVDGEVVDPRITEDGRFIFGVINGNLCRIDAETGACQWLSQGAVEGITFGLAEYAAQEEFDRSRGYWVSPDGAQIVLAHVDERHIPRFPIVHQEDEQVWLEEHRYPFVGQANANVRLGVRPISEDAAAEPAWLDWGSEERYLIDVLWANAGQFLVLTIARDHQHLAWDRYDAAGTWLGRVYEESSPDWINRPSESYITESGLLVSSTEREGGLRKLLVVDENVHIVPADVDSALLRILAVDEQNHRAYVMATRNRALERMLAVLDWETGEWADLTPGPGWHSVTLAPDFSGWVDQASSMESAAETRYVNANEPDKIQVLYPSPASREALNLAGPQLFSMTVEDGTVLNGLVYAPTGEAPAGGWPMVVSVYAGPHAQRVADEWSETVDLEAQYLAQHGILVMKLDSRGSANRGHKFEGPLFHRFGQVELKDQVAGVRHVAAHWPVNLDRVGIYGWSYGGYMTLRALLMAPDVFRVGVAGAPVTDFRWYDTAYTERYLGTDETNHEGYEDASVIDKADQLQGKLLLIHGMVDENVHFRHSAAMIQAFINAGKDFDLIVLPGSRHMPMGRENTLYRKRRTLQYFEENL